MRAHFFSKCITSFSNFRAVKKYTAEDVERFDSSMVDNSGVVEVLEGKLGIICSLDE